MDRLLNALSRNRVLRVIYGAFRGASLYHWTLTCLGSILYPVGKNLVVVGVTGTKGKTTTLELLNSVLEEGGATTALLSSVRMKIGETTAKNMTGNSMPGRFYVSQFLYRARKNGCTHALIEVTSEGVKLHRHRFIPWRIAALTNLAPEHIESHGSFEKYRDSKGSFLTYALRRGATVFLNRDDGENTDFYARLLRSVKKEPDVVLFCGSDIPWIGDAVPSSADTHAFFLQFNRENAAAARAMALHLGVSESAVRTGLEKFSGVPGRLQFVQTAPFAAVVDYAHTPDSLMKVYDTLRTSPFRKPQGRLIAVLGSCGGGRDKWKRPIMGRIAAEYADEIILTNEDPYDEDPEEIIRNIAAGFGEAQNQKFTDPNSYRVIVDRREALAAAVKSAKPGDIVVATGKGSESWIHIAHRQLVPWNEYEMMGEALAGMKV